MNGQALLPCLAFLATLSGCGGGADLFASGPGGIGSGGTGVVLGDITGFGSLIVNGIEYGDSGTEAYIADSDGNWVVTTPKLGQRVEITLDSTGTATTQVHVLPQLIGPVTEVSQANRGVINVLGQAVYIDSNRTVIDGFTAVTAVQLGDEVEVYGDWEDGVLQGVRLEKCRNQAHDTPVLFSGPVAYWTDRTLTLANQLTFLVDTTTLALREDQLVGLWVERIHRVTFQPIPAQLAWQTGPVSTGELPAHADRWQEGVVIKGVLASPNWASSGTNDLTLRDTPLRVPPDILAASNCLSLATNTVYATVTTAPGPQPLVATRLHCSATIPEAGVGNATVQITHIDPQQGTITLERDGHTEQMDLTDLALGQSDLSRWVGQNAEVELEWHAGRAQVRRVHSPSD